MKQFSITLLFIAGLQLLSTGQEFPYTLTTFTDEYVPLSEAIALTPSDDPAWDDPDGGTYIVPLGFSFTMMNRTVSNVAIIDPGCQVGFGSFAADSVNALSPYFADVMNANTDSVVSTILYTVDGITGSRICKMEWQNVGFYNEFNATGEFTLTSNFQVWLYEGTDDIEFRYGPNTIIDGTLIHDQWGSPLIFFIRDFVISTQTTTDSWNLRGDAANPTVGVVDLSSKPGLEDVLIGEPTEGLVYHFDTGIVGIHEGEKVAFLSVFPTVAESSVMTYWSSYTPTTLRVYDQQGKLMINSQLTFGNNLSNVSEWPAGVYYFTAGEGPAMQTKRVIRK